MAELVGIAQKEARRGTPLVGDLETMARVLGWVFREEHRYDPPDDQEYIRWLLTPTVDSGEEFEISLGSHRSYLVLELPLTDLGKGRYVDGFSIDEASRRVEIQLDRHKVTLMHDRIESEDGDGYKSRLTFPATNPSEIPGSGA